VTRKHKINVDCLSHIFMSPEFKARADAESADGVIARIEC
jgi:hypothetical protein